jgi:hypothetical protein
VTAALKVIFRYVFREQLASIGVHTTGARAEDEPPPAADTHAGARRDGVAVAPAGPGSGAHHHAADEDPVHPHDDRPLGRP